MSSGELVIVAAVPVLGAVAVAAAGAWAARAIARHAHAAMLEATLAVERERELNAIVAEATDRKAVMAALAAVHGESETLTLPPLPAQPDDSATAEELSAWAAEVEDLARRHEDAVRERVARRHAAGFAAALRTLAVGHDSPVPDYVATGVTSVAAQEDSPVGISVEDALAEIEAQLECLAFDAAAPARWEVQDRAAAVVTADDTARGPLLMNLSASVRRANDDAARRRRQRSRAEALLRRLDGFDSGEIRDLRALLQRVVLDETELLEVDVARVERARAEALAAMEEEFVLTQVARSFERLGYQVEEGFVRRATTADAGYARVPGSLDHAVEVRLEGDLLDYQLVRIAGTPNPGLDADLEQQLCAAMSEVTADAVERGASAEAVAVRPPGSAPLPERRQIADRLSERTASRRSERSRERPG